MPLSLSFHELRWLVSQVHINWINVDAKAWNHSDWIAVMTMTASLRNEYKSGLQFSEEHQTAETHSVTSMIWAKRSYDGKSLWYLHVLPLNVDQAGLNSGGPWSRPVLLLSPLPRRHANSCRVASTNNANRITFWKFRPHFSWASDLVKVCVPASGDHNVHTTRRISPSLKVRVGSRHLHYFLGPQ